MKISRSLLTGLLVILMVLAPVMQPVHTHAAAAYGVGTMSAHSNGWTADGIYATHSASNAPYNTDWSLEYTQTSVDNIKLIRDGETTSIGIVGRPMFVKMNETDCYLKLEGWTIGDKAPITQSDILIIEGGFEYAAEKVTLNIQKSYVYYDGSAWVCSANYPGTSDVGYLDNNVKGWNSDGIYAYGNANDVPYNTDWSVEYTPTSAENLKLIRNGETFNVGIPGSGTIVKYSEYDYFIKTAAWTIGNNVLPLVDGDILIVEGRFTKTTDSSVGANFAKTFIQVNGENLMFYNTEVGNMASHPVNGWTESGGMYFTMAENTVPYSGWSVR